MPIQYPVTKLEGGDLLCSSTARKEGRAEKDGLRAAIPWRAVAILRDRGWDGTWIEIELYGAKWIARARRHGTSHIFAIPKWCRKRRIHIGDRISFLVRLPVPCKPGPLFSPAGLDWAAVLPDKSFGTDDGDELVVHTRHEPPFRLRRLCPTEAFWLLGFYQSDGSKSATAVDWTFANKRAVLVERAVAQLALWGLDASRLYLEVLHGPTQPPDDARRTFTALGVHIAALRERPRKGKGGEEAAVLHVRSSKPLLRMTKAVLRVLVDGDGMERLSVAQAKQYAIGALQGDASVVWNDRSFAVRISGHGPERRVALAAVFKGFAWSGKFAKGYHAPAHYYDTALSLSLSEALDLLLEDVFAHSVSHVRLLQGIEQRLKNLARLHAAYGESAFDYDAAESCGVVGGVLNLMRKWDLLEGTGGVFQLTPRALAAIAKAEKAKPQLQRLRAEPRLRIATKKGAANPMRSRLPQP